jgi:acetoin utilization protein AcuB
MRVGDALSSPVVVLDARASVAAARRVMTLHDVRHLAVVERGRLVGVLSAETLAAAEPSEATSLEIAEARSRLSDLTLSQIPLRSPVVVGPATPLVEALRLLRELSLDALAVCDGARVVGLLSEDLLLDLLARVSGVEGSGQG